MTAPPPRKHGPEPEHEPLTALRALAAPETTAPDDPATFDRALLRAAFDEIAEQGWYGFTTASAARRAGLPLERAYERFTRRQSVALRLGELADAAALENLPVEGEGASPRERLFDALMQRFDVFQTYRDGVLAMLRAARFDPALAASLAFATPRSIGQVADTIGIGHGGLAALWQRQVLTAAWTYAAATWVRDDSPDLSATMAALDRALDRASRLVPLDAADTQTHREPGVPEHASGDMSAHTTI